MLGAWKDKTTWYLAEVKGGVQAFTSERGIDFSIRRLITEEYIQKIKENKVEPPKNPTDILPGYVIAIIGVICLYLVNPALINELSLNDKAVIVVIIIMLAVSHTLQKSKVDKARDEAIAKMNQGN